MQRERCSGKVADLVTLIQVAVAEGTNILMTMEFFNRRYIYCHNLGKIVEVQTRLGGNLKPNFYISVQDYSLGTCPYFLLSLEKREK